MKTFKTAAAANRAINKVLKSEAIRYKLNKANAILMPLEHEGEWRIFVSMSTTTDIHENCDVYGLVNAAIDHAS